ncbi:DUF1570 domain-containing protein [Tautonia rosea]|uniref:DUF1570 domain-containing protein n=1 Tax=Tautonia rosea TaxID=2728037 RepID=UPI001475DA30|nr:DUF1570 domain-containing protein [Tautonia rosea]
MMPFNRLGLRQTRRCWFVQSAMIVLVGSLRSLAGETEVPDREQDRLEKLRERAADAGLPELQLHEGERYVALGSAPDDFMQGALKLCEGLADDFLDHFHARQFKVEAPTDRMTIVALAHHDQFRRFLGTDLPTDVTGIYEIISNYLALYDGRSGSPAGLQAERANSITLFHEATHQLTFNSGLLDRHAEIPLAFLEGLAMYGEVRRPDGKTRIGAVNRERLGVLVGELQRGGSLFPMSDLISSDDLFAQESTVQMAYAQSWLMIYGLMREKRVAERLRTYLEELRLPQPSRPRLEVAKECLGDLEQLDAYFRSLLVRLSRGR